MERYIEIPELFSGYWLNEDETLSVFDFPFGPHEACAKCKKVPMSPHDQENGRCNACVEADQTAWERKLKARRELAARAMRQLRHAKNTLRKLAAVSDRHEAERLQETAGSCEAGEFTLDLWRRDYRGGRNHY